ncbi:unnamed protein product [Rotaria sp. Silwood1]|nr:unnamed protein product [Rotaria sp. Silwood1]CAF4994529.1 unnamed protein product [Rotaria sp. Silwood1]CAF5046873.1 unnamed protein product [Rotaria sp. Silwood1]
MDVDNCVGRVILECLGDFEWVNRLNLYNIALLIAGLTTMAAPLCPLIVYYPVGSDLVGVAGVYNALGIVYLFQGVATAIGNIRDKLKDFSQPYCSPHFHI